MDEKLPELAYIQLAVEPELGLLVSIPIGGQTKRFTFPLPPQAATALILSLLSQQSVAPEAWPKVAAILDRACIESTERAAADAGFLAKLGVAAE